MVTQPNSGLAHELIAALCSHIEAYQRYNQQLSKVSIIRNIKCTVEMTSTRKNSDLELRFFF